MSGAFKNNDDGSITIRCSHYVYGGPTTCDSIYPCHKLYVIQEYSKSKPINYWCIKGIIQFDWLDVLKIGNKKIERMANIRLGSKKEKLII